MVKINRISRPQNNRLARRLLLVLAIAALVCVLVEEKDGEKFVPAGATPCVRQISETADCICFKRELP